MLSYFFGDNTYTARGAIDDIAAKTQATIQWVDEARLDQNGSEALTQQSNSLFGRQLFVLRDPSQLPVSVQTQIVKAFPVDGATDIALWDRGVPDKRTLIWRTYHAQAKHFAPSPEGELVAWILAEAARLAGSIDTAAARALVTRVGKNQWRLLNELKRLLLQYEHVTAQAVADDIPAVIPAEIFSTLQAVAHGDRQRAVRSVDALLQAGASEFYILSMLGYQFRTLILVSAGLAAKKTAAEIARDYGVPPYAVQKNEALARQLPARYLRTCLTRIMATEFSIKQGRVDARTALSMLVLNLATPIASPSPSSVTRPVR